LSKFGLDGRVHFNVGGAQAIEDSLKLVRNAKNGKSLMFAFEGGYHGRTLGASSITSSYRYRRRYGHFGERDVHPVPVSVPRPKGMTAEEYSDHCVHQFARLFETEYNGVWDPKVGQAEYAAFYVEPIQGTGGYVIPPKNFFRDLKKVLDRYGILMVVDEIQMGFWRTGKLWSIEHFGVTPDVLVFGKALTNGLNPLSGLWAREELINPTIFPPGSTHSTFNSNPLGTSLGLEVLRMGHERGYETSVPEKGAHFLEGLRDLQKRHKEIGDVDGLGLALRAKSAPTTASPRTRHCWTAWWTSAWPATCVTTASRSASCSTWAVGTRTSSPWHLRWKSPTRKSTWPSPCSTNCSPRPSARHEREPLSRRHPRTGVLDHRQASQGRRGRHPRRIHVEGSRGFVAGCDRSDLRHRRPIRHRLPGTAGRPEFRQRHRRATGRSGDHGQVGLAQGRRRVTGRDPSQDIAITGMGAVSALGVDAPSLWKGLREATTASRRCATPAAELRARIAAQVPETFDPSSRIAERMLPLLDRTALLAVAAAGEAIAQSGWTFPMPHWARAPAWSWAPAWAGRIRKTSNTTGCTRKTPHACIR
jgi:acetylornithine/succinyldiaminopimelate/putrescine aminotransferase